MSFVTIWLRKRNSCADFAHPLRGRRYRRRMPRRPRHFVTGAPVHLTANVVEGQPLFRTDFDRFSLLALLQRVTERLS